MKTENAASDLTAFAAIGLSRNLTIGEYEAAKNADPPDRMRIAQGIRQRFVDRYLDPARARPNGFTMMAVSCLMIEALMCPRSMTTICRPNPRHGRLSKRRGGLAQPSSRGSDRGDEHRSGTQYNDTRGCVMMMDRPNREARLSDTTGLLHVRIGIENISRRGTLRELPDALVDTGADLSVVPRAVLEELGIAVEKREPFEMANGGIIMRDIGYGLVHAAGRVTADEIIFGEDSDLVILGARSLEGMALRVDLIERRLIAAGKRILASAA
jgi:aspartyl protease family protein